MKKLWNKFGDWCHAERVGRVEEGTSQDMCPTNGDALALHCIMGIPVALALLVFALSGLK